MSPLLQDGVWSDFKIDGVSGSVRISNDLDIGKRKEYFLSVRAKVKKLILKTNPNRHGKDYMTQFLLVTRKIKDKLL